MSLARPTRGRSHPPSMPSALRARVILDIPPRTRSLLLIAGLIGLALVIMESLVGRQAGTIGVDKIIHFSGYALLALVFVLALPPRLYVPCLLLLVAVGVGIEYLQPFNKRSFDLRDAYADILGLAIGAAAGLIGRLVYSHIRTELAMSRAQERSVSFRAGDVMLREGDLPRAFYIIQRGLVEITRQVAGVTVPIATIEGGDVLGVSGVVQGLPAAATATARAYTIAYVMTAEELMDSAGGSELPISIALDGLTKHLNKAVQRIAELEAASSGSSAARS